jgi:hypothetical protein
VSPNLGVAWPLPTQSLFIGLSHVSGLSVISLHTNTCILVMRSVNHQADGHARPFLHCPITKQSKTKQWDFCSRGQSSPSISVSSWSFEPQIGSSFCQPSRQRNVLNAPSQDRLVVVLCWFWFFYVLILCSSAAWFYRTPFLLFHIFKIIIARKL